MIAPTETLVKYENPVLVSKNSDKKKVGNAHSILMHYIIYMIQAKLSKTGQSGNIAAIGSGGPIPGPPKAKLSPVDVQKNQQTEEILNSILPPREWSEENQLWKQCVSSTPATRLDVMNLQVQLRVY